VTAVSHHGCRADRAGHGHRHHRPRAAGAPPGTIPTAAHDVPVDLVVTPEHVIGSRGPRPEGGIRWDELTGEKIAAIPLLAALRPR
jgi:hypothetical protein